MSLYSTSCMHGPPPIPLSPLWAGAPQSPASKFQSRSRVSGCTRQKYILHDTQNDKVNWSLFFFFFFLPCIFIFIFLFFIFFLILLFIIFFNWIGYHVPRLGACASFPCRCTYAHLQQIKIPQWMCFCSLSLLIFQLSILPRKSVQFIRQFSSFLPSSLFSLPS